MLPKTTVCPINLALENAFTLFDAPLHWEEEFPIVESLKNEILEHYRSGRLTTKSFLMKVTAHALSRQLTEKQNTTPRWRWVMAYDLARYRDTVRPHCKGICRACDAGCF